MSAVLSPAEFEYLRTLVKTEAGIDLGPDKHYLVDSRLRSLAISHGFSDPWALLKAMKATPSPKLVAGVIDAMTTNETFFFRDRTPFDQLRTTIAPAILKARPGRPIRVWSAACSTGQEPYSIAMTIEEMARQTPGLRTEILATDLSQRCLDQAKAGVYTDFEVGRGLSPEVLGRYFERDGVNWRVGAKLKGPVTFRQVNLMSDFSRIGTMDVIFCRNVLIYFDKETRRTILDRMLKVLAPEGYLILGGSETVLGLHAGYSAVPGQPSLYQPALGVA